MPGTGLGRLGRAGFTLALGGPVLALHGAARLARAATTTAVAVGATGLRAGLTELNSATRSTVRTARVARNALDTARADWRAGRRVHLAVRPDPDRPRPTGWTLAAAALRLAEAAGRRTDVLGAYWDDGLRRLVLRLAEDAVTTEVTDWVTERTSSFGLAPGAEDSPAPAHPGDTQGVRVAAGALAMSTFGLAVALAARAIRPNPGPKWAEAAVTAIREHPDRREQLRHLLGHTSGELVMTAVNAAARGFGRSPEPLVTDCLLRAGELAEAVGRAVAFDAAHDRLCAPGRLSVHTAPQRPPLSSPAADYAAQASVGSVLGAVATAVLKRSGRDAVEAVLAGSPLPARSGHSAFSSALGWHLARSDVLVRAPDRLALLDTVDTLVLHGSALRGTRRIVLDVEPDPDGWERDRLWQAASTALRANDDNDKDGHQDATVTLVPVDDGPADATGTMTVRADNQAVGRVQVGWELDGHAEAVLDAARKSALRVVLAGGRLDQDRREFAALVDEVVGPNEALADVVRRQRDDGHVVLTVARPAERDPDLVHGLLSGDLCLAITERDTPVLWGADLLALDGLPGVWRVLTAVSAATANSRRATTLAKSSAALSGLLVVTRSSRRPRMPLMLDPVATAGTLAVLSGWWSAWRAGSGTPPPAAPRVWWHAMSPAEAMDRLTPEPVQPRPWEVAGRWVRETAGQAARAPVLGPGIRLTRRTVELAGEVRAELADPLTPVLTVGAAASAVVGSPIDAMLVAGAMTMNAFVGGAQRLRGRQALRRLRSEERQRARRVAVPAGGESRMDTACAADATLTDARKLATGDVIAVRVGDVVPVDGRLIAATGLELDESALTGESLPVEKQIAATPGAPLAERRCMVFAGTTVISGEGRAVVTATGSRTVSGRAVALATRTQPPGGIQARLHEVTRTALPWTAIGGVLVAALSLLRGNGIRGAVAGGVAVAVAAVPEGLPLVATVAQMAGARRLARHGILVRTPRALEAMGRLDTICFDKTGTLTRNRLRVARVSTADGVLHEADDQEVEHVLRAAARACPGRDADSAAHAHATDDAILAAGPDDPDWRPTDGQPFTADRGYSATVGEDAGGGTVVVVKGAPEVVLPACRAGAQGATQAAEQLTHEGLRVIAVARRTPSGQHQDTAFHGSDDEILADLELLGFLGLSDTPRDTARPLVTGLRSAGIRPVMLTGDHPSTAHAIAVSLGWPEDTIVVTGDDLAALDRRARVDALREAGIVARVAPEQKLQVIEALRDAGEVVAMIGDGANDAAAIRAASVGIGIQARGSAAARNAADLVLTRDELTVLLDAVAEGYALWHSVADAVTILIGGNAGEVGFTVLGTLLGGRSPLSTRQLLLVNLLTDMFPAMAVAVTRPDDDPEPTQGKRPAVEDLLAGSLARNVRVRGITTGIGATVAWLFGTMTPGTARRTSTMALCGVVGAQLVQTLVRRWHSPLVLGTAVGSAAALAAIVQTPGISQFFGCVPLGPLAWAGVAAGVGAAALGPVLAPANGVHTS